MTSFASTSETGDFLAVMRGFAAGGLAAVVSKTATAPAERVKLILQLQTKMSAPSTSSAATGTILHGNYTGIFDCFKRLCAEQGIRSLWRGNFATVARCFPTHALNFALRDHYRLIFLKNVDPKKQYGRFIVGNIMSGALGSSTCLCLVYPLDLARTRLAVEANRDGTSKYRGIYDCLRTVTRREGFVGAYRGFGLSLQHVTLYGAVFFGMFDTIRCSLAEDARELNFFTTWFLAQACVVSSSMICYPLDSVRRKMILQSGQKVKEYSGSLDCIVKMFRNEGAQAFYRGALCNSLKSMSGALILATYYESLKYA